jgi:sugar phosphate isomerase/epimerase
MIPLSYQLYSSRNGKPPGETLMMLADAGYEDVEGYGPYFDNPQATLAQLQDAGLVMTSGHFTLAEIEADPARVLEIANTIGLRKIYAPYLTAEERPTDRSEWESFSRRLIAAGRPIQDAGLIFGWHNHEFELVDLGGGLTPEDLIAQASPDLALELDLGWVHVAGHNPIGWIERYGRQITTLHIKDRAPAGENLDQDGWATVGKGVIDWPGILAAAREAGIRHWVVENDLPADDEEFARSSITYLKSLKEVRA